MHSDEISFDRFRIDLRRRELSRDGETIRLHVHAIGILCELAAAKGEVVSKDELMSRLWPGRPVEEGNLHVHISALRKALGGHGEGHSYIVTVPGRGYRLAAGSPLANVAEPSSRPHLPLPDRPSIAVMPFANLSGDPEQEYFADGMVEAIITALSRFRQLFVIAGNSSFTYKGRAVDVKLIGRELGVRYVLEGSVRKAANRLRITGQLIDASTGTLLWADRFDGQLDNVFDLQDEVAAAVVGIIAPTLEKAEIERAEHKPTKNLDAYDHYLRACGMANLHQMTNREAADDALRLLRRAIELDPTFAPAYGLAALCIAQRRARGWMTDRTRESAEAARLARRAVELSRNDAAVLASVALTLAFVVGDLDAGIGFVDRALQLNPNLAMAWYFSGWIRLWNGKASVAIEHFAHAMRQNPLDPFIAYGQAGTAHAHFSTGRYDEASSWARMALRELPDWGPALRMAAASDASAERMDSAKKIMVRVRQLDPTLSISNLRDVIGPYSPDDFAKYAEGLRKAGLPE
jgi:TolB-like protein